VEIGGGIDHETFSNPPPKFLLKTLEPNTEFVLAHARTLPRLELREWSAEALGDGMYRLRALLVNSGYLPTYGSRRALVAKAVQPIRVEVTLPSGAEIVSGQAVQDIGHLEGRANKHGLWSTSVPTDHLRKLEWIVRGEPGSEVGVTAVAQRAGTVRGTLTLG